MMMANKPEAVLYRALTYSLLTSHGGISSCVATIAIIITTVDWFMCVSEIMTS